MDFMEPPKIKPPRSIRVECYSGYKADERPLRFFLGDHPYEVGEILDQWYGLRETYYKVVAKDKNHYILCHHQSDSQDYWTLEAYRHPGRSGEGVPGC